MVYHQTPAYTHSHPIPHSLYKLVYMHISPIICLEPWCRVRSGCARPWRRGVVTVRGEHGLLQIRRTNGEATVPFKAMGQLIGRTKTQGLKAPWRRTTLLHVQGASSS